MIKKLLIVFIILSVFIQSAYGLFSPRALGMGSAYTALADDAYAAYWNPAGLAIDPGIDLAGHYQVTNRNKQIGDNAFALKACFEVPMSPFAWIAGVGLASIFAYQGARYMADQGIVKKGWGRKGKVIERKESVAEDVKAEKEAKIAAGEKPVKIPISRKEIAKKAVKQVGKATLKVSEKFAKAALKGAARQTRHYYHTPGWYRPNYYRPTYWDNRYDYRERELTPQGKAQFAGGISIMSDRNDLENQITKWYTFSVASGYGEVVALGGNLNIYDLEVTSVSPSIRGFGAGLDLGGLVRFSDKLSFGMTVKEILTTDIRFEDGSTRRYEMTVNAGVALKPYHPITLAADVHNIFGQYGKDPTMHYGVEVRPIYGVAVRAGLDNENKTAGISFGVGDFIIDYAILGGIYNRTQMVGVTWTL
jgi:hypothetical protein